jgi:hypothetical protein
VPTTAEAIDLPFHEAIDFFRGKVRVPTDHWTGVWKEAHTRGFMVAGAASDALLSDFQQAIQKALEKGTTLAEFRADFDRIVKTHGWQHTGEPGWRAQVIYETNLSTAYSAGRYAQQTDPDVLRHFPYWQYRHSGSRHPRLMHLAWDGLTLRADDPWWDTHYPPNGWHCGCRVSPTSEGGMRRMGKDGPDASPPLVTKPWTNPRTGELHHVPVGIDPGFDYNVGKAWRAGRAAELPVRAPNLRPVGPREPQPTDKALDAIREFVRDPKGTIPIGRMPEAVKAAIGAQSDVVLLSADTMEKQLLRHPDLTVDDYLLAPLAIAQPSVVVGQQAGRVVLLRAGAKILRLAIKTTLDRAENYLLSLHYMDDATTRKFLARAKLLFGSDADVLR